MNIVGYCRVSTDKSDQLNSLETQKRFFAEYAAKQGYNLVRVYADEGISGTKIKNRKEFLRLMEDAHHGFYEMVVVKDISRFARNTVDLLNSTRQLRALNIETMFLTSNMSVLGNSEFVLTIFGALAQEESANTSKRVKFGKQQNAKKGRVPTFVYGYNKTIGDNFNLTINQEEATVVNRIYDMYVRQGYGASKISFLLNEEGIRTRRNLKWSQNSIARILKNEIYSGIIVNGKEEVADFLTGTRKKKDESEWMVAERPHLRIVDQELWEQAQRILEERYNDFHMKHERHSNKHLFSTLIKCSECGYSFRRTERTYQNSYIRWVCSGRNSKGMGFCENKSVVDEEELITFLREYFEEMIRDQSSIIKTVKENFIRAYKSMDDNLKSEAGLQDKLCKIERKREQYLELYSDEIISKEELRKKIKEFDISIEKIQNELRLVLCNLSKGEQLEELLSKAFEAIEHLVSIENLTNAELKNVIDKIIVNHEGKCDIHLRLFKKIGLDETVHVSDNRT